MNTQLIVTTADAIRFKQTMNAKADPYNNGKNITITGSTINVNDNVNDLITVKSNDFYSKTGNLVDSQNNPITKKGGQQHDVRLEMDGYSIVLGTTSELSGTPYGNVLQVNIGIENQVTGLLAFAHGKKCKALGRYTVADGYNSVASGQASHAEGSSKAFGSYSHSQGYGTQTNGQNSHAEGQNTIAFSADSHAQGRGTVAKSNYQHVEGKFNVIDDKNNYQKIVGGGTSDNDRKNIYTLDWNGNQQVSGYVKSNDQFLNARAYSGSISSDTYNANYSNGDLHNIEVSSDITLLVTNIPLGCALIVRSNVTSGSITFGGTKIVESTGIYYMTFGNPNGTIELIGKAVKLS